VLARAIFPAVVVVNNPVGIRVILPPLVDIGDGAVIVAIAVVPEINTTFVVGAIVVAEAIVGADPPKDIRPLKSALLFRVVVPVAPETEEPISIFVIDPLAPPVPIFNVFVTELAVALPNIVAFNDVVGVPPNVKEVAPDPSVSVVGVCNAVNVDPASKPVEKVGDVLNTTDPLPVVFVSPVKSTSHEATTFVLPALVSRHVR